MQENEGLVSAAAEFLERLRTAKESAQATYQRDVRVKVAFESTQTAVEAAQAAHEKAVESVTVWRGVVEEVRADADAKEKAYQAACQAFKDFLT
jgi:hypothetical protein